MIAIKQSTATIALVFELRNSSDAPVTLASPTVTLSKNGGTFAAPAGLVSEIGNGFYKVAPNATDTNTIGILALYATAAGAKPASMAYPIVQNIEADSIAAIAALNNINTTQIRTELATELARIDAAITTRATPADIPTISEIIGAAGGLTQETVAALEAADQILLASPYTPTTDPIIPLPAPDNAELAAVYAYTEAITGTRRAGITARFELLTTPAAGTRLLEAADRTATTNAQGLLSIHLLRNQTYRITSRDLALDTTFTPTGETFDLITLIP
jgi:hypothetical protein